MKGKVRKIIIGSFIGVPILAAGIKTNHEMRLISESKEVQTAIEGSQMVSVKNKFSHANLCLRPKVCRYRKGMVINMTKTMKIEGMMCGHCEARVKKVLEALPEVEEAVVSHEAGTAVLTLSVEIMNDVLKKTIEDQDYKVLSIE